MNGAEALLRTLAGAGVDVCFANPGTTEMPLVSALDAVPAVRPVLGVFEGVCTGAADGYGRIAGRPAAALLHLGPGLANGLANLHNARRARSPLLTIVGDQATWHRAADAPLTSDIESLAAPMSGWVRTARTAAGLAADGAEAIAAAMARPRAVATLIVPQDCQWDDAPGPVDPPARPGPRPVSGDAIDATARALRESTPAVILLGGDALRADGLQAAARLAQHADCTVLIETFAARREAGRGLPDFERLPYFPEPAIEQLAGTRTLILAGATDPVAFFGYPNTPSRLAPEDADRLTLAAPGDDASAALSDVADAMGAPAVADLPATNTPEPPSGPLDVRSLGRALVAHLPEGAILVNEAATSGAGYEALCAQAAPHTVLGLTGGAIGQGLPTAVGAAVAAPDRRVVAFEADGSGLYTAQALWTMAREALDVTVVVAANDAYRILQVELGRAGETEPGPAARGLTSLTGPAVDWVRLAAGFGVPGVRVATADELSAALARSLAEPGPSLIQAQL